MHIAPWIFKVTAFYYILYPNITLMCIHFNNSWPWLIYWYSYLVVSFGYTPYTISCRHVVVYTVGSVNKKYVYIGFITIYYKTVLPMSTNMRDVRKNFEWTLIIYYPYTQTYFRHVPIIVETHLKHRMV